MHRYRSSWIVVGALAAMLPAGCSSDDSPEDSDPRRVRVAEGELEGAISGAARHFFGIPFAEPPVGELRWKAPVPKTPWTDVLSATELSAKCAQGSSLTSGPPSNEEDCLYLNVWTPYPLPKNDCRSCFGSTAVAMKTAALGTRRQSSAGSSTTEGRSSRPTTSWSSAPTTA